MKGKQIETPKKEKKDKKEKKEKKEKKPKIKKSSKDKSQSSSVNTNGVDDRKFSNVTAWDKLLLPDLNPFEPV